MTNTPRFLLKDENGNIGYSWQPDASSGVKGVVRVDGTTIISNNGVLSAGAGIALPIGALIQSLLPLSDAAYLLLDGALIQGGGSYAGFYNYLENLYSNNPNAAYFCTEAQWQASVNTYGSCGKFVIDTVNKTIRLPKVSDILQGTTDVNALGSLVEAGLPVMTSSSSGEHSHGAGSLNYYISGETTTYTSVSLTPTASGDVSTQLIGDLNASTSSGTGKIQRISLNANRNVTGNTASEGAHMHTVQWGANTNTVQPQAIKCLIYIAAAAAVKTDIEVDIDNIMTDLAGKADADLVNLTPAGEKHFLNKSQITNCILEAPNGVAAYSGSTITVKKGLKVLIPNGRNADGTLKNTEYTLENDKSFTNPANYKADFYLLISSNGTILHYSRQITHICKYLNDRPQPTSDIYIRCYVLETNKWYISNDGQPYEEKYLTAIGIYGTNDGNTNISYLDNFNPTQILTYNNRNEIGSWGMPAKRHIDLNLGASNTVYTAPADGWFFLHKLAGGSGQYCQLVNQTTGIVDFCNSSGPFGLTSLVPVLRGEKVQCSYTLTGQTFAFRFIYAQGEV